MRSRGQGLLTVAVAGIVAIVAASFARLGPREPAGASHGSAPSATWLCPHGGGRGYEGTVFLANPGATEVDARVTTMSADGVVGSSELIVPARGQVAVEVDATDRSSSTFVETFGRWVGAGWLIRGAEGDVGIGAEPCASSAGSDWVSAGASTGEGDDAFLVVMNPFDTDAVFDVALFGAERAPVRDSELTDVTVRARRSTAIELNLYAQGEEGLGVSIGVSSGRVAASTLLVSDSDGIASVLAADAPAQRRVLLTSTGTGRSQLAVAVPTGTADPGAATPAPPGQLGTTFTATLRSQDPPQPAGALGEQAQEPESAVAYPVTTTGPSAVDVVVREGSSMTTALRTPGAGNDAGATGGSSEAAVSWVVTPTIAGEPARPGVLVLNPQEAEVSVTLTSLPSEGQTSGEATMTVPAGGVAGVPRGYLNDIGNASLLVTGDEPIVVVGASTSLGNDGLSVFGLASGVPITQA